MRSRAKGCARVLGLAALGLAGLCLILTVVSVWYNRSLPTYSQAPERLSELDKARLAEVFHLRQTLGEKVLPGWSRADIPVVLYNEGYLFLMGIEAPQSGWTTVPRGSRKGQDWELVAGDDFLGKPYYRQQLLAPGEDTQAFTVRVGEDWAASMATFEWMRISMASQIREELPGPVQSVVPYGVMVNLLIPSSDVYVTTILHESVHAYQGKRAGERLIAAERAARSFEALYPWEDEGFQQAWQEELDTLFQAARAGTREDTRRLSAAFLNQREARREAAGLSTDLVNYERAREWEEGIAKYGELMSYRLAAGSEYAPLPEISSDPAFHGYAGAQRKWDQEIDQMRRMAGAEGDGRFYYSGFAQAVLLDRLAPGWKDQLFSDGVWLEDLLASALKVPE